MTNLGMRSTYGVAATPFTQGPYTWDQNLTMTSNLTVTGTTAFTGDHTQTGNLAVTGNLDVDGNFTFGDAVADDLTIYGHISTADAKTGKFIETGTYSSSASKGITVSASNSRPASFLFDDAGAALTAGDYRPLLGRMAFTVSQTAGSVRLSTVRGHTKVASGLTIGGDTSQYYSVEGILEAAGTMTIGNSGDPNQTTVAGVCGQLWMDGSATTNGYLAGVMAKLYQSSGSTTATTSAFSAMKAYSSTDTWGYGLYIPDSVADVGIYFGTMTTGISLAGATTTGISIVGSATDGIKLATGTFTDAIEIAGTSANALNISGTATTGITISAGSMTDGIKISGTTPVDGIEVSSACSGYALNVSAASATGVGITGACTTGIAVSGTTTTAISLSGDATTGISVTSGMSATNVISIAATGSNAGVLISGACGKAIEITGSATTGIGILTGTYTSAIDIAGTTTNGINLGAVTNGLVFSGAVTRGINFVTGSVATSTDRSTSAISFGKRGSTAYTVTLANTSSAQHIDPIQMNVTVAGVDPGATTTMNMIYQNIDHTTAHMANLRLKGADWTVTCAKNVQDIYVFQGEVDFTANTTVGGEVAGLGLSMTTGATSAVTGNVWGAILMTSFTSAVSVSASLFISHRVGTLTHGIYFEPLGSTTMTNMLYLNNAGTVTNFFQATTESGGIGATRASPAQTATCDGSLKVLIGAKTLYIPLYNAVLVA